MPDDTAEGTDDRYARFLSSPEYREGRQRKAAVIARLCRHELSRARRIADLGAGTGIIKNTLEARFSKHIVGFDIDHSFMLERDRMVAADASRLPVRSGTFDLVILNHIYEHVTDQGALFREVQRVLEPGGLAYVSAGNRLAVVEPHYRLPFLSWLPKPLADRYVRWTRRGNGYEGIRFRTYRPLRALIEETGLRVRDITARAIDDQLGEAWGPAWLPAWKAIRVLPERMRGRLLESLSPQWFFLLEKPAETPDPVAQSNPTRDTATGPGGEEPGEPKTPGRQEAGQTPDGHGE